MRYSKSRIAAVVMTACLAFMSIGHANGQVNVLYSFKGTGSADGANPYAGLVMDPAGNLYGTTVFGGSTACRSCGIVFELSPASSGGWTESILHTFVGADGSEPWGMLIRNATGTLYGTAQYGGVYGGGTVYKIDANGSFTVLYNFTGGADGGRPASALQLDNVGNLYGTTVAGGTSGNGTVFEVDTSGNETVLYSFAGSPDGSSPYAGQLIWDSEGNLYGTTGNGGNDCGYPVTPGCGTVYKLTPTGNGSWTETVLYRFTGGADGGNVGSGLVRDASGNLYSTTYWGGIAGCDLDYGCGVVFEVNASGNESVRYTFRGGLDGSNPDRGVLLDSTGNLYGSAYHGGGTANAGTIYEISPTGGETILWCFSGPDGANPDGELIEDASGNLYGTTVSGGANGLGVVFEIPSSSRCTSSTQYLGPTGSSTNNGAAVSEPVSTGNGNYYYQHTDLNVPGRGLPFVFSRSYNALDTYSGPLGGNWTHTYNVLLTDSGTSVLIKWGDGHTENYASVGGSYVSAPGVYNVLVKNADGSYTITQKSQTKYNFTSAGKLSNIVDKNGNLLALVYDGNGNLIQISDTVGRIYSLTYNSINQLTQLKDPIGRTVSYTYSSSGDLATVTDPLKGLTTYSYDTAHHVTSITLPGNTSLLTNVYDSSGRVTSQTNGRKFTTTFAYNTPGTGQTTITDPLGNTAVHTYDNLLRITQITDALNGTLSYTYDSNNDRLTATNQDGNTTTYTYDGMGNVTSVTDALTDKSSFTYDSLNDLLTSTNPRGNTTTFTYDGNGNLLTVQDALSDKTTFAYDSYGELTAKTDANGHKTTYAYDTQGNLVTITDALSHATKMGYDGISRLTSVTDANGNKTSSAYDALSRLIKTTDALGNVTQFKYSPVSNLTKVTDANGNSTSYAYDATNNLTAVTDAATRVTRYTYDANNNRISFTNANGKKTTYAYDKLNRLSLVTDPLKYATAYAYDAAGNVTTITDANGHATQYAYDALNRLAGISYYDGTSVAYTYDADGDRLTVMDARGTSSYAYDVLDRLTSVTQPGSTSVSYAYDPVGHRSGMTYPDGKVVQYSYDAVNRLSSVTDWISRVTNYSYDPASRLTGTAYPNTAAISLAYDAANRLTQVKNTYPSSAIGASTPYSSYTYVLDKVGNRTQVTDGAGNVTAYGYDPDYELTSVSNGSGTTSYTYDKAGNRMTLVNGSGTTSYTYDADDRLTAAGTTRFTYDKNGNRTKQSTRTQTLTYAYDPANRLMSVKGGAQASSFAYDGDGHRVSQTVGAGTYTYANDVAVSLPVVLQENGPDGFISYNYGLGLVSESGPTFDYYYHPDGLGSIVGLTDPTGTLQQGYAYDAWGNDGGSTNYVGTDNKFRYTGQGLDPGGGLYFLRARYLDTATARLVTQDPLFGLASNPASLNRYKYALNNPIRFADTSGLSPLDSSPSDSLNNYLMAALQEIVEKTSVDLVKGVSSRMLPAVTPSIDQDFARVVPFVGQALSIGQSIEDARNHPERSLLEDFQRGSIDLAFSATLSVVAYGAPGAAAVVGPLYQASRVQVQNRILEDAGGWLTNLISHF